MDPLAKRMQAAAEERLRALDDFQDLTETLPFSEWPEHPPAAGPYCGCTTCIVREVLDASWSLLRQAIEEEEAACTASVVAKLPSSFTTSSTAST